MESAGDWSEYRRLVVNGLAKIEHRLDQQDERLGRIESDLAQLRVKSGVWGAVAGILATLGVVLAGYVSHLLGG